MQSPVICAQALAKRPCCYRVATIAGRSEIITLVVAITPLLLLAELEEIMAEHKNVVIDQVSPILDIVPPREARRIANSTNEPVIDMGLVRHIVVVDQNFLGTPLCAQLRISAKRDFKKIAQEIADTLDPSWIFLCAQTE